MFLLFLIGLGTADVNAQVRIGGNAAPQGAAVLDLNADNTAAPAANKGALALPRVRLDSTTMRLNGTTPITGMLVWNTNTTVGTGVYYWSGTAWVKTSLPPTAPSDSGFYLMSNGNNIVLARPAIAGYRFDSISLKIRPDTVKYWTIIVDTVMPDIFLGADSAILIWAPGLYATDVCRGEGMFRNMLLNNGNGFVKIWHWRFNRNGVYEPTRIMCFRPVH